MKVSRIGLGTGRSNAGVAGCKTADPSPVSAHVKRRTASRPVPPNSKANHNARFPVRVERPAATPTVITASAAVACTAVKSYSTPGLVLTAVRSSHRAQRFEHRAQVNSYPIELSDVSDSEPDSSGILHNSMHSRTLTTAQTTVRATCTATRQKQRGCRAAAMLTGRQPSQQAAAEVAAAAPSTTPSPAPMPARTAAPGHSSSRSMRLALLTLLLFSLSAAALLTAASGSSSMLYKRSEGNSSTSNGLLAKFALNAQGINKPLLASWLDEYANTSPKQADAAIHTSATARARPAFTASSSSKRHLVTPPAALPAIQTAKSMFMLNSVVVTRVHLTDPSAVSMHTGSGSSSSSSSSGSSHSGQDQPPAAASRDAAAAAVAAAGTTAPESAVLGTADKAAAPAGAIQMFAVVSDTAISPYKGATWGAVIRHMAKRLYWTDSRFVLNVITQQQLQNDIEARNNLSKALSKTSSSSTSGSSAGPMFVGIAISDPMIRDYLRSVTADLSTVLFWESGNDLDHSSRVDGFAPATASLVDHFLAKYVGLSSAARSAQALNTISSLWARNTSDDLLFIWLVLLNEYVTPVSLVADTTKGMDLESLWCMISNCGGKIMECVTDETCKKGLDCLQGCAFNDQVCQYRCIVSYESPKFEQFSLCILQLHNCRGLNAQMPSAPDPKPMTSWRGQPITHEVAESLFIGWKAAGPQMPDGAVARRYSWLIAGGKNAAYDHFPCQYQLYSYGKGKGQLWYEPVFKVITLDGQEVWRRRRYRVRRGAAPGTFHYSALDNGVTSNEYWRILDCAEDLTYCLFYYSGAASVAGLSYSGAVLGTVDGVWPKSYTNRIHDSLRVAGIEPWELNTADNSRCADAPF